MQKIYLESLGHYFPSNVLDNHFFEQLDIGTDANWILDRTGIKERRSVLSREAVAQLRRGDVTRSELVAGGHIMPMTAMIQPAWKMLLERVPTERRSLPVDLVIGGTSIPDDDIPAHSCSMAKVLNLNCAAFDVNSACSTFIVHLHVARSLLHAGNAQRVALLVADRYSTRLDFSDRRAAILFGDAACAGLVSKASAPPASAFEVVDTEVESNPQGADLIQIVDNGNFQQNGPAVQKFAVTKTVSATQKILSKHGLGIQDIGFFISHQANYRMLVSVVEKLGFREDQHLYNVDLYGNQGGCGAPCVLSLNWEKPRSKDYIVVTVVGAGLTWGAALLRRV